MEDMSVNSRAQVVDETNLFTSELGVIQEHQSSKSKMDVFNIEGGAGAGVENAIHGTVSDLQGQGHTKTPKSSTPNSQSNYRQRAHSSPEKAHNRSSNSVVSPRTNGSYRVGAKGQSPTQHSNPHALHSIRYNIAHKLSEGQEFTSSGAKILVVGKSAYLSVLCFVAYTCPCAFKIPLPYFNLRFATLPYRGLPGAAQDVGEAFACGRSYLGCQSGHQRRRCVENAAGNEVENKLSF